MFILYNITFTGHSVMDNGRFFCNDPFLFTVKQDTKQKVRPSGLTFRTVSVAAAHNCVQQR